MTAEELLARAGDLPDAREAGQATFAPIVSSPLLIAHVRGAGRERGPPDPRWRAGRAGVVRRPGRVVGTAAVTDARTASVQACAQAFDDELRRAARDGLGSMPEPVGTSAERLLALGAELLV